jgi:hypothetical protein
MAIRKTKKAKARTGKLTSAERSRIMKANWRKRKAAKALEERKEPTARTSLEVLGNTVRLMPNRVKAEDDGVIPEFETKQEYYIMDNGSILGKESLTYHELMERMREIFKSNPTLHGITILTPCNFRFKSVHTLSIDPMDGTKPVKVDTIQHPQERRLAKTDIE